LIPPVPTVLIITHDDVEDARILTLWRALRAHGTQVGLSVRNRRHSARALLDVLRALRDANAEGALLVSRRADVAVAAGVGLHLPARGIPSGHAVDRLAGALVVRAAHNAQELARVAPAAAALVSPVHAPRSHASPRPPLGWAGLHAAVDQARGMGVDVLAMGGLGLGDVAAVKASGAVGLAVASEVFAAVDPAGQVFRLLDGWSEAPPATTIRAPSH
jgi:thiamine-phosphate pyrophosphorylase